MKCEWHLCAVQCFGLIFAMKTQVFIGGNRKHTCYFLWMLKCFGIESGRFFFFLFWRQITNFAGIQEMDKIAIIWRITILWKFSTVLWTKMLNSHGILHLQFLLFLCKATIGMVLLKFIISDSYDWILLWITISILMTTFLYSRLILAQCVVNVSGKALLVFFFMFFSAVIFFFLLVVYIW